MFLQDARRKLLQPKTAPTRHMDAVPMVAKPLPVPTSKAATSSIPKIAQRRTLGVVLTKLQRASLFHPKPNFPTPKYNIKYQFPARGHRFEGCRTLCSNSTFGCCADGVTPSHGPNAEGCCLATEFKCCPDNISPARGPDFYGCGCQYSRFGCCPDNENAARGPNNEGCGCQYTSNGCCPNKFTPATGPNYEGCPCYTFQFGCCPDGVTVAKGPHGQGIGFISRVIAMENHPK